MQTAGKCEHIGLCKLQGCVWLVQTDFYQFSESAIVIREQHSMEQMVVQDEHDKCSKVKLLRIDLMRER